MGIFDKISNFRKEKQLKSYHKYGDTLKNKVTTKEQRVEAIEALCEGPADVVIPQLLKRFELVIDHGMQDTREKELVTEFITKHKDVAKPFIREELKHSRRISWLIKAAEKIFSKEEYTALLLENMTSEFAGFDEYIQDRNIELMLALKEVSDPRIVDKAAPHLYSRDENVRVAALECLEAQGVHNENARKLLTDALAQPLTDDNSRFLGLIRTAVQRHGWM